MLSAWSELPWWLRLIVALIMLGLGFLVFWYVSIKLGIGLMGLGAAMLMVGGRTDAEKNGYNF